MIARPLIFIATIFLASCTFQGGRLDGADPQSVVSRGETQAVVQQRLGKPGFSDARGRAEAWQYCSTGLINDTYRTVWFVDGTVVDFSKTNASLAEGFCDQAYPAVNWGNRPASVILE